MSEHRAAAASRKKCFVMMPISTPDHLLNRYAGDSRHFLHIFDCLFKPAFETLGIEAISPVTQGSGLIHAQIVKQIEEADYALCDMSTLNANVFFELGIRTAINRSVILIKDSHTDRIPFDTGVLNTHTYCPELRPWTLSDEIQRLSDHIKDSISANKDGGNEFMRYFSLKLRAEKVQPASEENSQIAMLSMEVKALRNELRANISPDDDYLAAHPLRTIPFEEEIRQRAVELLSAAGIRRYSLELRQNPLRLLLTLSEHVEPNRLVRFSNFVRKTGINVEITHTNG